MIDDLLAAYKSIIGGDYDRYRNHVYRVFLNCLLLDNRPENKEKYAVAAVFHDIGIWTDNTIDYLAPSIEEAGYYLHKTGNIDWIEEIALMIEMHHKFTAYRGKYEATVTVFRKADWIDVSLGLLHFGVDKQAIQTNRRQYKNLGFHLFLTKTIIKSFLKNPFRNPLPMFSETILIK